MPTAAKLVAALSIGALACLASILFMPLMPDSTDFGYFIPINLALGLAIGWRIMGAKAGRGITAAINNGLGGAFVLVLAALFLHGCGEMVDRAMDNWYDTPFAAFGAVIGFMAEFGLVALDLRVIAALLIGGALAGLATEAAGRRWR